jgi:hypothetical protein
LLPHPFPRVLRTHQPHEGDRLPSLGTQLRGQPAEFAAPFQVVRPHKRGTRLGGPVAVHGDDMDPLLSQREHLLGDPAGVGLQHRDADSLHVGLCGQLLEPTDLPPLRGVVAEQLDADTQLCPGILQAAIAGIPEGRTAIGDDDDLEVV